MTKPTNNKYSIYFQVTAHWRVVHYVASGNRGVALPACHRTRVLLLHTAGSTQEATGQYLEKQKPRIFQPGVLNIVLN